MKEEEQSVRVCGRAQELCESRGGRPDDDDELMLNVLRCHETY